MSFSPPGGYNEIFVLSLIGQAHASRISFDQLDPISFTRELLLLYSSS